MTDKVKTFKELVGKSKLNIFDYLFISAGFYDHIVLDNLRLISFDKYANHKKGFSLDESCTEDEQGKQSS